MHYELYIDVLFLENLLLDYLLLSLLKTILKCQAGKLHRLLAAALGSAGLCLLYAFSLERSFLGQLLLYGVLGAGMVKIGLSIKGWQMLGKAVTLLYVCSVFLGGLFQWVQRKFLFPVYPFLGISLISYCFLWVGMHWMMRFRSKERNLYRAVIQFQGRSLSVKALRDTGNCLRDPIFGKPVSIITEALQKELCQEAEVLFLPIPFHSVGEKQGLLQGFFADYLYIQTQEGETRVWERPLLGITKEPLSSKDEYDMILHPELLE